MKSANEGGEWFLAIGILLLFSGLILWAILPGAGIPPLLLPAALSVFYGAYCVWSRAKARGQSMALAEASGEQPPREMLMVMRKKKVRGRS
ncbi:MAG: hypothetical protein ACAI35_15145 [Candidatus Methylacidiphilales bacterium]|nr:hypothetical protein [Candidatus Methylacidiphilales bacterium]